MDGKIYRWKDRWMERQIDRKIDGWKDIYMDRKIERFENRLIERQIEKNRKYRTWLLDLFKRITFNKIEKSNF